MLKGELTCELTGLGNVALIEGLSHLFYLPPGVKHTAWFYPGEYISFHISFAPAYLKNLASVNASLKELWHKARHGLQNGKRHHPSPIHPRIKVMIQEIIDYHEGKAERELYLQARIRDLLLTYIKDIENSVRMQVLDKDVKRLHAIHDYILGNLNKPLNIAILAKKFELSETTLKRWFRQYYQRTIGAFLIQQRMEKALDMLINTNVPISQIGNLVGYNESSNFTRAFTTYFNNPPSYFRKS